MTEKTCWKRGRRRVLLAMGALLAPTIASATPLEAPAEIAISPADPDLWAVRFDYSGGGLVFSRDAGQTWRLTCNGGLHADVGRETAGLAFGPGGELFTGTFTGLLEVAADGCSALPVGPTIDKWIPDVVNHPTAPDTLFAVSAGGLEPNGLFRYSATDDAWSELGSQEMLGISRLRVVTTASGLRLYESMFDGETMITDPGTGLPVYYPNFFIRYSDDLGSSWSRHAFMPMVEGSVRLEAVNPADPETIVVSVQESGPRPKRTRLWINKAAGASDGYALLAEVEGYGGVAFAPDGRLWFGDSEDTIYEVSPGSASPVAVGASLKPRCLTFDAQRDQLLACGSTTVMRIERAGAVTTVLDFDTLADWVECDGTEGVAKRCEQPFADYGWCHITHYPMAGICADYCYPGLNEGAVGSAGACPPDTVMPTQPDGGDAGTPWMDGGVTMDAGVDGPIADGAMAMDGDVDAPPEAGVDAGNHMRADTDLDAGLSGGSPPQVSRDAATDASPNDVGEDAGDLEAKPAASDCGCHVVSGAKPFRGVAVWALIANMVWLARRRRVRSI